MNLRSYSDCLQMPCTVTSGESLGLLLQYSVEIGSQTATSIKLKMADTINFNAYQMWLHKLKGSSNDDAIMSPHMSANMCHGTVSFPTGCLHLHVM